MSGPYRTKIGASRARLSKYITDLEAYEPREDAFDTVLENVEALNELKAKIYQDIAKIQKAITNLEEIDSQWVNYMHSLPVDQKTDEEKVYEKYVQQVGQNFHEVIEQGRTTIDELSAKIQLCERMLGKLKRDNDIASNASQKSRHSEKSNSSNNSKTHAGEVTKLPKLQLGEFHGDLRDWPRFWDSFRVAVHEQKGLSDVTKFNYLITYVKGRAAAAIAGLPVTAANYKKAIEILLRRFGNEKIYKASLYSELQKLPIANEKLGSLRHTFEAIEKICFQLEEIKEDITHPNLIMSIETKFPKSVYIKIQKAKQKDSNWDLHKLRSFLDDHISSLEEANRIYYQLNPPEEPKKPFFKNKNQKNFRNNYNNNQTAAFSSVQKPKNGKKPKKITAFTAHGLRVPTRPPTTPCLLCGREGHWSADCKKFPTKISRLKHIKEVLHKCTRCLKDGHFSPDCKSTNPCFFCSSQHHSTLCDKWINMKKDDINPHPSGIGFAAKTKPKNPNKDFSKHKNKQKFKAQIKRATAISNQAVVQDTSESENSDSESDTSGSEDDEKHGSEIVACAKIDSTEKTDVLLASRKCTIFNPQNPDIKQEVLVFFDCGSHRSFAKNNVLKNLELKPIDQDLFSIYTFAATKAKSIDAPRYELGFVLKDGTHKVLTINGLEKITHLIKNVSLSPNDVQTLTDGLNLARYNGVYEEPAILLGSDYMWRFISSLQHLESGHTLVDTSLGPILCGPETVDCEKNNSILVASIIKDINEKNDSCNNFWSLENIGITDNPTIKDDDIALDQFHQNIRFENGRYVVKWPFKDLDPDLPNNYSVALARLKYLIQRLKNDPALFSRYDDYIKDYYNKGIIELAPKDHGKLVYYQPHREVLTPDKSTTKLRVVHDASSKIRKSANSLNEVLYRGPIMLPDLCGTLLRFRCYQIPILCDVEKAFLQLSLDTPDRDVTRFLWLKDINLPITPENIIEFRFTRVNFGEISSPFLLQATIRYHLKNNSSDISREVGKNLYVDNVILHASSDDEAILKYHESKNLFLSASMNLREYMSNNLEFNKYIEQIEGSKIPETTKVLGLKWHLINDTIELALPSANSNHVVTKRHVLQVLASIFDPLGLIAPSVLKAKLFLQYLWRSEDRYDWDTPLKNKDIKKWGKIISTWHETKFIINRKFFEFNLLQEKARYELHIFTDSSNKAFASVAYLRVIKDQNVSTNIIFSKNRIAPIKEMTIPRLELLGVLIGARITKFLHRELEIPISRTVLWSDSLCVLGWINSNKDLPKFVHNRIKEIKSTARDHSIEFRYINTLENPADLSTKGLNPKLLINNELWWNGPAILKNEENWPEPVEISDLTFVDETILYHPININEQIYESIIQVNRFSNYKRLIRTTAYVFRFITRPIIKGPLNANEIQKALKFLIYEAQNRNPPPSKTIKNLDLYTDESKLFRCKGRLEHAELANVNPIYLPKDHFTSLLIIDIHKNLAHSGVAQTLAELRQQYWLSKGRTIVKNVIKNQCMICRKYLSKPFMLPNMPSLPKHRVTRSKPFQFIGLDGLGPFYIKFNDIKLKIYVILYTCMSTRAIHLEYILDLTAESFLQAFRRFIARRGRPDKILSDNAQQYILTAKTIKFAWTFVTQDPEVINYLALNNITWAFITELSPWMGGFYERLNSIIKNCFRRSLGQKCLTFDQFNTFLCEVEAIVNSRPLTYLYDELNSPVIIRPIDFIIPKTLLGTPDFGEDHKDPDFKPNKLEPREKLLQFWSKTLKTLDLFWQYWTNEYLQSLRENFQMQHKGPKSQEKRPPKLDEIVLIHDDFLPRGAWKMGRIIDIRPSADQNIRSVSIELPNKTILNRSISHIYPLEISCDEDLNNKNPEKIEINTSLCIQRNNRLLIYFLIVLASSFIRFDFSHAYECKNYSNLKRIYTQICVSEGYSIYEDPYGYLCYEKFNCALGYAQLDEKNLVVCKDKCLCPKWALDCSNYDGKFVNSSTINNNYVKKALLNSKVDFCSLELTEKCDNMPIKVFLNQIQLFDNTKHFVKNLHIQHIDIHKDDFQCIYGRNADKAKNANILPISGTPEYCKHFECVEKSLIFCFYKENERIDYVYGNTHFPIKAWGQIKLKIYPYKNNTISQECLSCRAKCTKFGIRIFLTQQIRFIEVRIFPSGFSLYVKNPEKTVDLNFPKVFLVKPHTFEIKLHPNTNFNFTTVFCNASDICDIYECIFCYEFLHCKLQTIFDLWAQTSQKITFFIIFLIFLIFLCLCLMCFQSIKQSVSCCCCCCRCLIKIIQKTLKILKFLLKNVFRCFRNHSEPRSPPKNKITINSMLEKFKISKKMLFSIYLACVFSIFLSSANSCVITTSLTGNSATCITNKSSAFCSYTKTTLIDLAAQGAETCLLLKDKNFNNTIGILKIEITDISSICDTETLYYTRSYKYQTVSSKRCPYKGTCTDNKCASVAPNDFIDELKGVAYIYPGITNCISSCSCFFCGCGWCLNPGCLFFRNYIFPTSYKIYRIFTCIKYLTRVELTLTLVTHTKTITQKLHMFPEQTETWNGITLKLNGFEQQLYPSLIGKVFISDGKNIMLGNVAPKGVPSGVIGSLQCPSKNEAINLKNCTTDQKACDCHSGNNNLPNCRCPEVNIEQILQISDQKLPLNNDGIIISSKDDIPYIQHFYHNSLQAEITLKNFELVSEYDDNECFLKIEKIDGCFSCSNGATLTYTCKSSISDVNSFVYCDTTEFPVFCDVFGLNRQVHVDFNQQKVNMNCSYKCNFFEKSIHFNAILKPTTFEPLQKYTQNKVIEKLGNSSILQSIFEGIDTVFSKTILSISKISQFFTWIYEIKYLLIILLVLVVLLFIYCYFKNCLLFSFLKFSQKHYKQV